MKEIVAWLFGMGLVSNIGLFLPQALQVWRAKSGKHISLITFGGFHIVQTLGMLHGHYQQDFSLFWGMAINNVTCGLVTILALKYRKQ
jgi:MtN3 and saliva related transmembrane protein